MVYRYYGAALCGRRLTIHVLCSSIFRRMMVNLARERTIYIPRLFMLSLFVPFILAFLGHMKTNQESIQDRIGLMYQSASVPPYVSILNAVAICKSPTAPLFPPAYYLSSDTLQLHPFDRGYNAV